MDMLIIPKNDQYADASTKYFRYKHPTEGVYTENVYVDIYKNNKVILDDLAKLLGIKGRGALTKRELCPKICARIHFEN